MSVGNPYTFPLPMSIANLPKNLSAAIRHPEQAGAGHKKEEMASDCPITQAECSKRAKRWLPPNGASDAGFAGVGRENRGDLPASKSTN